MNDRLEEWKSQVGNFFEEWRTAEAEYTPDGKTLKILGREVMQEWETDYMKVLASIVGVKTNGRILEVGFGMGISASFIQEYPIQEHVIIEANKAVFQKLEEFSKTSKRKVTPIFGYWQEVVDQLPDESFDGILFDTYPISQDEKWEINWSFFKDSHRLLKKGGILTYYSNEVDNFSPQHLQKVKEAGFTSIEYKIIQVNPPETCEYWIPTTTICPRITKT